MTSPGDVFVKRAQPIEHVRSSDVLRWYTYSNIASWRWLHTQPLYHGRQRVDILGSGGFNCDASCSGCCSGYCSGPGPC